MMTRAAMYAVVNRLTRTCFLLKAITGQQNGTSSSISSAHLYNKSCDDVLVISSSLWAPTTTTTTTTTTANAYCTNRRLFGVV
jgi:hypothetical protein